MVVAVAVALARLQTLQRVPVELRTGIQHTQHPEAQGALAHRARLAAVVVVDTGRLAVFMRKPVAVGLEGTGAALARLAMWELQVLLRERGRTAQMLLAVLAEPYRVMPTLLGQQLELDLGAFHDRIQNRTR